MSRGRLHQRVCRYNGELVYVRDHTYLDDTYQRLSNWVTFSKVNSDGVVAKEISGDYDKDNFQVLGNRVDIVVHAPPNGLEDS